MSSSCVCVCVCVCVRTLTCMHAYYVRVCTIKVCAYINITKTKCHTSFGHVQSTLQHSSSTPPHRDSEWHSGLELPSQLHTHHGPAWLVHVCTPHIYHTHTQGLSGLANVQAHPKRKVFLLEAVLFSVTLEENDKLLLCLPPDNVPSLSSLECSDSGCE